VRFRISQASARSDEDQPQKNLAGLLSVLLSPCCFRRASFGASFGAAFSALLIPMAALMLLQMAAGGRSGSSESKQGNYFPHTPPFQYHPRR
jgi:hypothetical protein